MARIQLFRDAECKGGEIVETDNDANLKDEGFNDVVSSVIVSEGTFTLFQDVDFKGFAITVCKTGGPNSDGRYPNPQSLAGRNDSISSIRKNSDQPL